MLNLTTYVTTSVVLAAGVILYALHIRPNFYSACVYLTQSNYCLILLANFSLVCTAAFVYGLQRLLYGPLRPIEVEQLYERGWIALMETGLAMTLFRDEIGGWFLVMLIALMAGRVWGWIGEGRVDFLEQQPPSNPRVFHARLSASLVASLVFSFAMLKYSFDTVVKEARPGMMVMFAFEFAILVIQSSATLLRYLISLKEASVVRQQTEAILQARLVEREANSREGAQGSAASTNDPPQEPLDQEDVDVPGWEDKGRYIFALDLVTDLLKLLVYLAFLSVIITFHGFPLHLSRDLFVTAKSFVRRIIDFVRYRKATKDMNARYPDATAEELASDNTCIICREEMRPWQPGDQGAPQQARPVDERLRPKKLPCGHILHFACLRSWLERQQACPTCRRSVLAQGPARSDGDNQRNERIGMLLANPPADVLAGLRNRQNVHPGAAHAPPVAANAPPVAPAQNQHRTFNIGPLRIALNNGQPANQARTPLQRAQVGQHGANPAQPGTASRHLSSIVQNTQRLSVAANIALAQYQLTEIERQIAAELRQLNLEQTHLNVVRALQSELERLRQMRIQPGQSRPTGLSPSYPVLPPASGLATGNPPGAPPVSSDVRTTSNIPSVQGRHHINAGSSSLRNPIAVADNNAAVAVPAGMTLPEGWHLVPLRRRMVAANARLNAANTLGAPSASNAPTSSAALPGLSVPPSTEPRQNTAPSLTQNTSNNGAATNASLLHVSGPLASPASVSSNRPLSGTSSWSFGQTAEPSSSHKAAAPADDNVSSDVMRESAQETSNGAPGSSTARKQSAYAATVEDAEGLNV